jgi:hypothetical protein
MGRFFVCKFLFANPKFASKNFSYI